jgi:hypothetical protein
MSEQITILQALPFLAALIILTLGVLSSNFRLKFNKLVNSFFAGVLVLSFISLQILTFTYVLKFDIYYGLNAALLIAVLAAITFSPQLFIVINSIQLVKFSQSPGSKIIEEKFIVNEIAETQSVENPIDEITVSEAITEELLISEEIQIPKEQEEIIIEQPVTKPEVKSTPKKKPARKHGTSNTKSKRSGINKKTGGKK